jgi:hypothetical protein
VTSPREFDERLADLSAAQRRAADLIARHRGAMHRAAGDKQTSVRRGYGYGTRLEWGMSTAEVVDALRAAGTAADLLAKHDKMTAELSELTAQIAAMDEIYEAAPWQRYFPCRAHNGHIHATERGCHTIGPATEMGWRPDLSGQTVAEAVADLGEALCSHCFPDAPAKWTAKTLTQVERERTAGQRAEAAAVKAAAKAAKELTADEAFRSEYGHDKVTTVAECKNRVRKAIDQAVEMEWYARPGAFVASWPADQVARYRRNSADMLAKMERDAETAAAILEAREAAHPGWGATAAEIAKMRASKRKSARKEWGF